MGKNVKCEKKIGSFTLADAVSSNAHFGVIVHVTFSLGKQTEV